MASHILNVITITITIINPKMYLQRYWCSYLQKLYTYFEPLSFALVILAIVPSTKKNILNFFDSQVNVNHILLGYLQLSTRFDLYPSLWKICVFFFKSNWIIFKWRLFFINCFSILVNSNWGAIFTSWWHSIDVFVLRLSLVATDGFFHFNSHGGNRRSSSSTFLHLIHAVKYQLKWRLFSPHIIHGAVW